MFSVSVVSNHSVSFVLPRKPSWPKTLMLTNTIVVHRAQLAPPSRRETDTCQEDAPEQHDPAPAGDVEEQEARRYGDVVVVPQERDQPLEEG